MVRASRNSCKSQVDVTIACVGATIPPIRAKASQPSIRFANDVRISGISVLFAQNLEVLLREDSPMMGAPTEWVVDKTIPLLTPDSIDSAPSRDLAPQSMCETHSH